MVRKIPIESDTDKKPDVQSVSPGTDSSAGDINAQAAEGTGGSDDNAGESGTDPAGTGKNFPGIISDEALEEESKECSARTESSGDSENLPDDPVELKKIIREQNARIDEAEQKICEHVDQLQRLKAEFENFRKRSAKEKADTICFANEQLLKKLLTVYDNLKRGSDYAVENAHDEEIAKGISMVKRQLFDLMEEFGVKPFLSLGQEFDPNLHEPLYTVEDAEAEPNTVVEEIEEGYMFQDRVLRHARVAVSRKPEEG